MQYTPHYNLNLPEGTDIVNPLVQDNPNYTAIDTAMYANKLRVIGTATEIASGTVHALTRSDTDIDAFKFVATVDFNTGDTFTVDGVSVTARRPDGATMKNKAYVINSTVLCILDGTILNFIGVDGVVSASDVTYDNTSSGLVATDVNDAIDEVYGSCKIKKATFSANTDATGNVILTGSHIPIAVKITNVGALAFPTYFAGTNAWYAHVTSIGGSPLPSTLVIGDYYYFDE